MTIVGRHCVSVLLIHSIYLVIHPPFIYANYSHPIAEKVLIVSQWTVNCIVKTIFQQILYLLYLLSWMLNFNLIDSFLLNVLYRKNR